MKYDILPKAVKWTVYSGTAGLLTRKLLRGDEREDFGRWCDATQRLLRKIPEHDLTNYMCIPLGETDDGKCIYFVMPHDFTGQVIAGVTWKALQEEGIGKVADVAAGGMPYESLNPVLQIGWDAIQFSRGQNPYDFWRGRPVVSETKWEAGGMIRAKEMLKQEWNRMGGGYFYRFPYDNLEKARGDLEKILNMPIGSQFFHRFVRISNRGEIEQLEAAGDQVKQSRARELVTINEALADRINQAGNPNIDDAVNLFIDLAKEGYYTRKDWGRFLNKYMQKAAQVENDPLIVTLWKAGSTKERAAILSQQYDREVGDEEAAILWKKIKMEFIDK